MKKKHIDDVFRHNFLQSVKLYKACAKDDTTRPVMECVHFEDGYAFASDSHVAVRMKIDGISNLEPEEIEKLNGKTIHGSHFKQLLDCDVITEITDEGITATNIAASSIEEKQTFFKFKNDCKYPKIQEVFQTALGKSKNGASKLGIKPKLLLEASDAMDAGKQGVVMEITNDREAIVVYPISILMRSYAVAIVMPVMVTDED